MERVADGKGSAKRVKGYPLSAGGLGKDVEGLRSRCQAVLVARVLKVAKGPRAERKQPKVGRSCNKCKW